MTGPKVLQAVEAAQEAHTVPTHHRGASSGKPKPTSHLARGHSPQAAPQQEEEGMDWDKEGEQEGERRKGEK